MGLFYWLFLAETQEKKQKKKLNKSLKELKELKELKGKTREVGKNAVRSLFGRAALVALSGAGPIWVGLVRSEGRRGAQ